MDFDTRLKALARLAESRTEAAEQALAKEFEAARSMLSTEAHYDRLYESLGVVEVIGFRFSNATLATLWEFAEAIDQRPLVHDGDDAIRQALGKCQDAPSLLTRVIQILVQLRYLETAPVLRLLIKLAGHPNKQIQKRALEGLEKVASYDIAVFYGDKDHPGVGAEPQQLILRELEGLNAADLNSLAGLLRPVLRTLLSPAMEAGAWTYNTLTISQTGTPPTDAVSEVRRGSIELLKRLFRAVHDSQERLATLAALSDATRLTVRTPRPEASLEMYTRDTLTVLTFFRDLIESVELQIVQKIEHYSYWIYAHAINTEVAAAARAIESRLAVYEDYQIFRVLIGFEGIFGDWESWQGRGERYQEIERHRRETARLYATEINEGNYGVWRERILRYARTESEDLATFPIFYDFLSAFARAAPRLAYELLSGNTRSLSRFLIPILSGLWQGPERPAVRALIDSWMTDGGPGEPNYRFAATRMFLSTESIDAELLAQLSAKAMSLGDLPSVREVINVVIAKDSQASLTESLLLPALHYLSERGDASWVFNAWYRPEARALLSSLGDSARRVLLGNLRVLPKIDYHAEEILSVIAERWASEVIDLMVERLDHEIDAKEVNADYEAIPFEFYKLHESLSDIAVEAVAKVRAQFDRDRELFEYRGARLLSNIFPRSSAEFESALLELIRRGQPLDLEFVLGVLRNYHGEGFVRQLTKEVVRRVDEGDPLLTSVSIALLTTGMVSGEFGMADAYARKREELRDWIEDPDSKVKHFAESYIADLEKMVTAERARAEEQIALRKHRYGEG
jgi:hypothetical protein